MLKFNVCGERHCALAETVHLVIRTVKRSFANDCNTLVDFLDGESYDYTLNQPRRFVPKRKGKNLNPEMYI